MLGVIYTLIIYPLTQVIEFTFVLVNQIFGDVGFAVIGVSVVVSILCLPLYIVAEHWTDVERDTTTGLSKGVARIKSTFAGDEQYMILAAFYRENHYSPIMALRSSFGLIIQIPFFIAAYNFLSNLDVLREEDFLFIKDMGSPDSLFTIGTFHVNILPIAMTVINIVAGAIYSKGHPLREKIQIYAMALIFLVILYDSPAALVLYWTCNNIFSLVKNVFMKMKNPLRCLYFISATVIVLLDAYLLFVRTGFLHKRILLCIVISSVLLVPVFVKVATRLLDTVFTPLVQHKKSRFVLFALSSVASFLLCGVVIPSLTVSSSVTEFLGIDKIESTFSFVGATTTQAAGVFILWAPCVYFLFGKRVQAIFSYLSLVFLLSSLLNTFIFTGDYATLSRILTFASPIENESFAKISFNIIAIFLAAALPVAILFFLQRSSKDTKEPASLQVLNGVATIIFICLVSLSFVKIIQIKNEEAAIASSNSLAMQQNLSSQQIKSVYHLSKTQRNVILIMLDRAEGAYLMPIFKEFPKIAANYTGFVHYPNTVSFNQGTLLAAPALFGGYEYTPLSINERSKQKLVDKHNEALLMLPRIFTEQSDYHATVADLSWANYSWIPDLSICDGYPKISATMTERKFTGLWLSEHPGAVKPNLTSTLIKRNMGWFSLFRISPTFFREALYHNGSWWGSEEAKNDMMEFLDYYSTLTNLCNLTSFDGDGNQYIAMVNDSTHSGALLQPPAFDPALGADLRGSVSKKEITSTSKYVYNLTNVSTNIAALREVGKWLAFLKENGCYDNTRIVIVADHGMGSGDTENLYWGKNKSLKDYNCDHNNPLLLFKDFDAKGSYKTCRDFMTNADVPAMLLSGIVENPKNPFTQNPISKVEPQQKEARGVVLTHNWAPSQNTSTQFKVPKSDWYIVRKNIFDKDNWEQMDTQ